ncbi:MAG: B12-binding domain-containing radical SAM protein, partial [Candidatus Omnitrophica bacterium]|nr:B12-binding domain-containing radical SAM protein [Candidatus Omnitrophota bacterium]
SVKWLSSIFDYKKRLISELKAYKPDLIGISVVTDFYQWACTIARMAKQEMGCPIIFGGIHPTSVPERVIKNDFVDMVCVGEGEYPMLELANSLEKGEIDYSIKNIWFKKDGKIIQNEIRHLIEDLDSLPMPDKELYYSASPHFSQCYYIMTSRGCQYNCSYCCHSYLKGLYKDKGRYIRSRSVKNVIRELNIAKQKYSFRNIRFFDESLGSNNEWLRGFSTEYKRSIGLPFICYMHPDHVTSETLKYLKDAGCHEIEIGVQSGVEKIRRELLNRNMSNKAIGKALSLIKGKKISVITDNIFGLPGEVQSDAIDLALFYNRNRVSRIYFFWLRFYPKIAITEWARENMKMPISEYERIMEGNNGRPFSCGGDMGGKDLIRLQLLFFILPFFSEFIFKVIIKSKIYRIIPIVYGPGILAMLTSLFSSSVNDKIIHKRFILHYAYSINRLLRKV